MRSRTALALSLLLGCASPAAQASPPESVPTPPIEPATSIEPLRVVFVSDLNSGYGSTTYEPAVHAAVARIRELDPALVIATGDMVAGQRRNLPYARMWEAFHHAVTEPLAQDGIPFAVTPGNHDGSGYRGFEAERTELARAWTGEHRPALSYVDDDAYPRRYAFRMGDVLFVSLDATLAAPLDEAQHRWLDALLGRDDAQVTIVFGHLPLHPLTYGREHQTLDDPALEEILLRHEVDAYVSGHHHAFYPARHGSLRLIGVGCLGTGARRILGTEQSTEQSFVVIEIDRGAIQSVEALEAPDFRHGIDRTSLPPRIGTLERDDVASAHEVALE